MTDFLPLNDEVPLIHECARPPVPALSSSTRAGDACADAQAEVDGSGRDGLRWRRVSGYALDAARPEVELLDRLRS